MSATVESVERFLADNPEIGGSPEAALALKAAELLDDTHSSTTSKSMVMGGYLRAMETLRGMLPEKMEASPLDEIRARRDAKLAAQGGMDTARQSTPR